MWDWNLFWNAFGAIGTTVGSIITAIAVIIAIQQFKQPLTKRLKVVFTSAVGNLNGYLDGPDDPDMFYVVSIANKGIRECSVNSILIEGKKDNMYLNTAQYKSLLSIDFPHRIKPEEELTVFFEYDGLRQALKQHISEGWRPKYRKLRIKVTDTSGDYHYGKTNINFLKTFK